LSHPPEKNQESSRIQREPEIAPAPPSAWLCPFAVLSDEIDQPLNCLPLRDVKLDRGLADVEVDLAWRAADVAEIGIGHFAGAVDDAAHDGDFHAFEMLSAGLDAGGDGLQIKQSAATGWASDIIRFE